MDLKNGVLHLCLVWRSGCERRMGKFELAASNAI